MFWPTRVAVRSQVAISSIYYERINVLDVRRLRCRFGCSRYLPAGFRGGGAKRQRDGGRRRPGRSTNRSCSRSLTQALRASRSTGCAGVSARTCGCGPSPLPGSQVISNGDSNQRALARDVLPGDIRAMMLLFLRRLSQTGGQTDLDRMLSMARSALDDNDTTLGRGARATTGDNDDLLTAGEPDHAVGEVGHGRVPAGSGPAAARQ